MSQSSRRGWSVVFAGTGINLALGVLYSWSVISKKIPDSWGWDEFDRGLPYTIAALVFALMMIPAGMLQDRYGPRLIASIGGLLTGVGFIIASQFTSVGMFILGFGILAGSGIGFGYACATPPAVKWFPPAKTGMVAGIVVSGFGLASVYIAPLANYLIIGLSPEAAGAATADYTRGINLTMLIMGIAFLVIVVGLSQILVNPPARKPAAKASGASGADEEDYTASKMLKTPQFYMLWLMFAFNAGAGLMIIGKLAMMVQVQSGSAAGFILVALLAIGNAGGRLIAGFSSDKLGRNKVLLAFTAFQCILMFVMPSISNLYILVIISMCVGMCYGSNLALFPSFTKDYFGLKNFGLNYGLVFTAWGVGSIMALVAGRIYDKFGRFDYALYIAGVLLIVTIVISFITKKPAESFDP